MVLKDFDMVFEPNRKKNAASKRNSKTQQQNRHISKSRNSIIRKILHPRVFPCHTRHKCTLSLLSRHSLLSPSLFWPDFLQLILPLWFIMFFLVEALSKPIRFCCCQQAWPRLCFVVFVFNVLSGFGGQPPAESRRQRSERLDVLW